MRTLEDIMTREIVSVGLDDTLEVVRKLFARYPFHHLVVVERGRVVGVISDRDLLKHVSPFVGKMAERPQDLASLNRRVHQIMQRQIVAMDGSTPVDEAACIMLRENVTCLPVVDDRGACLGIVSWKDLLAAVCGCELPNSRGFRTDGRKRHDRSGDASADAA